MWASIQDYLDVNSPLQQMGSKHKRKIGINVLKAALSIDFDDAAERKKAVFGTFTVYSIKFSLLKTTKQRHLTVVVFKR